MLYTQYLTVLDMIDVMYYHFHYILPYLPYITSPILLSIPPDLTSHTMNTPSLGVIYYQQGDALSAIPYIEMAVKGNKTYEVM